MIESAQLALAIGKHAEALAACDKALQGDLADAIRTATLLHMKGQAHLALQQYQDAIKTWSDLIA